MTDGAAPESALLVPVPEAEPCVRRHRFRYDSVALRGVPAHITVLYPFVPPPAITDATLASVREVLARIPAFWFRLSRLERFPEGALYLAPEPADPFVQLVKAFGDRFPDYPPYGGIHAEVIPHLTVAQDPDASVDEMTDITDNLPITCHAREALLMVEGEDHEWSTRSRFPLTDGTRT